MANYRQCDTCGAYHTGEHLTLADWARTARYRPQHLSSGAACVSDCGEAEDHRRKLWRLADYRVTSVTGGTIWLMSRKGAE